MTVNKKIIVYLMAVVICVLQCAGISAYAEVGLTSGIGDFRRYNAHIRKPG